MDTKKCIALFEAARHRVKYCISSFYAKRKFKYKSDFKCIFLLSILYFHRKCYYSCVSHVLHLFLQYIPVQRPVKLDRVNVMIVILSPFSYSSAFVISIQSCTLPNQM